MQTTAQRLQVPAGFSGWWCTRCEREALNIPEEIDAAQAQCKRCHKWTAFWIPAGLGQVSSDASVQVSSRARAGEERRLKAGAEWQRKMPTSEDAKRLFAHVRQVIENPELEPDLRKLDERSGAELRQD